MLLASRPREVDLGKITFANEKGTPNSRYFLSMAGIGFDAKVVLAVQEAVKARLKTWAYILCVAREAFRPPLSDLIIRVDGEEIRTKGWFLLLANGGTYGWRLRICPGAKMDDGLLDLCVFPDRGRLGYLGQFLGTLWRTRPSRKSSTSRRFSQATIESEPRLPVQLDGDVLGTTPLSVSVAPLALRLLAPDARAGRGR